jgi:predicted transcriptional regulator
VERAASIGCTVEDIAALLGLSRKTIYNHMEQDPELAEAMDRGRGMGRASLRRMQWEKAEAGSDTMLIWLGKVLCGQKDTSAVVLTGPNNGPVQSQSVSATVEIPANDPIEAARVYQKLMSGDG